MASYTHIARPYAKAIFEIANEQITLSKWLLWLESLLEVVNSRPFQLFLDAPEVTATQQVELIGQVLCELPTLKAEFTSGMPELLRSMLMLLATHKRLAVLPDITAQFNALKSEAENRLHVQVRSFMPMSEHQKQALIDKLSLRFNKSIELDATTDSTILGGAIISIPETDWVIDGSTKGHLEKLSAQLQAR